jgi:hypothetical protein
VIWNQWGGDSENIFARLVTVMGAILLLRVLDALGGLPLGLGPGDWARSVGHGARGGVKRRLGGDGMPDDASAFGSRSGTGRLQERDLTRAWITSAGRALHDHVPAQFAFRKLDFDAELIHSAAPIPY